MITVLLEWVPTLERDLWSHSGAPAKGCNWVWFTKRNPKLRYNPDNTKSEYKTSFKSHKDVLCLDFRLRVVWETIMPTRGAGKIDCVANGVPRIPNVREYGPNHWHSWLCLSNITRPRYSWDQDEIKSKTNLNKVFQWLP